MILFREEYKIFVVIYNIKIENFSCKLNENMSNVLDVCCSQQDGVYCFIRVSCFSTIMIELYYVYKIE